ncbi:hypothetical protein BGX33_012583, partial [Mortierella sp. NVP41]
MLRRSARLEARQPLESETTAPSTQTATATPDLATKLTAKRNRLSIKKPHNKSILSDDDLLSDTEATTSGSVDSSTRDLATKSSAKRKRLCSKKPQDEGFLSGDDLSDTEAITSSSVDTLIQDLVVHPAKRTRLSIKKQKDEDPLVDNDESDAGATTSGSIDIPVQDLATTPAKRKRISTKEAQDEDGLFDDDENDAGVGNSGSVDTPAHDFATKSIKRARRTKKQKDKDTLTDADKSAAGATISNTVDTKTHDDLASTPAKRKRRTIKQKDDGDDTRLQDDADYHGLADNETTTASTPKRHSTHQAKKAESPESTPSPSIIVPNPSSITIPNPTPINKPDPCAVLPTEIWHQVLTHLPLSTIARASSVSKAWLDGSRSCPVWKTVCETGGLGAPKQKYKSHMALASAHSYWVCERCFGVSKGRPQGSNIPLPVSLANKPQDQDDEDGEEKKAPVKKEDQGQGQAQAQAQDEDQDQAQPQNDSKSSDGLSNIWQLCLDCRKAHFDEHPEPLRDEAFAGEHIFQEETTLKVTKTGACGVYGLTEADLSDLAYQERRNPHRRNGHPMRLYDRNEVQKLALDIHAGWVGVDAVRDGLARKRQTMFREQSAADQSRKKKASDAGTGAGPSAGPSHEQQERQELGQAHDAITDEIEQVPT